MLRTKHPTQQVVSLHISPYVYTDGACRDQSLAEIRTAACGIWAQQGNLEGSFSLPGADQSAVRAEIYAVWWALRYTMEYIIIVTDNQYVADTLLHIKHNPFFAPADHLDLWADIAYMLNDRKYDVIKVQAHRKEEDVLQGGCQDEIQHYMGNKKADELAVKAVRPLTEPSRREYFRQLELNYTAQATIARVIYERNQWDIKEDARSPDTEPPQSSMVLPVVRKRLGVKSHPSLYLMPSQLDQAQNTRLRTMDLELRVVASYPDIPKMMWEELIHLHPSLKPVTGSLGSVLKKSERQNPREVLGTTYPATLYDPLLRYWSTVEGSVITSEYEQELGKGTTWLEAALDFFAHTGYAPSSLDYGCTNVENMVLCFMIASKRLFHKHGTIFKTHVRKNYRLQTIGMGELTGLDGSILLLHPHFVYTALLHRHFVSDCQFEHRDRLKFVPHCRPPTEMENPPTFTIRRGVLAGTKYLPTYNYLQGISGDVVEGKVKAKARITSCKEKSK